MKKVVVITGATKGIGRALAQKFVAEEFNLALCARTEKDLNELKAELIEVGADVFAQPCDMSKPDEVKLFGQNLLNHFGGADVLINNAGVFLPGQVWQEEEGTLEKLMETNLYSAYHLSRVLVPAMVQKKSGHIFNVSSVAGIKAYPNGGSYSISKFALMGLSKALREELKEFNIRVTTLIPGATYTNSWAGSGLPESRFMKAEDIAKAVFDVYSLSESTVVEEIVMRPLLGDI
jgi:short-subunit dehydrogenase